LPRIFRLSQWFSGKARKNCAKKNLTTYGSISVLRMDEFSRLWTENVLFINNSAVIKRFSKILSLRTFEVIIYKTGVGFARNRRFADHRRSPSYAEQRVAGTDSHSDLQRVTFCSYIRKTAITKRPIRFVFRKRVAAVGYDDGTRKQQARRSNGFADTSFLAHFPEQTWPFRGDFRRRLFDEPTVNRVRGRPWRRYLRPVSLRRVTTNASAFSPERPRAIFRAHDVSSSGRRVPALRRRLTLIVRGRTNHGVGPAALLNDGDGGGAGRYRLTRDRFVTAVGDREELFWRRAARVRGDRILASECVRCPGGPNRQTNRTCVSFVVDLRQAVRHPASSPHTHTFASSEWTDSVDRFRREGYTTHRLPDARAPFTMTATPLLLLLLLWFFACAVTVGRGNLQTVNEWTLLQYDVPFNYPNADSYRPEVTVPTGIEIGKWQQRPVVKFTRQECTMAVVFVKFPPADRRTLSHGSERELSDQGDG